jgi:hypothetical protein
MLKQTYNAGNLPELIKSFFPEQSVQTVIQYVSQHIHMDDEALIKATLKIFPMFKMTTTWRSQRAEKSAFIRFQSLHNLGIKDIQSLTFVDYGAGEGDIMKVFVNKYATKGHGYGIDVASWHDHDNLQALTDNPRLTPIFIKDVKSSKNNQVEYNKIPTGTVDIFFINMVLHHLTREQRVDLYRLVYRVLKPTGMIVIKEHDAESQMSINIIHLQHLFYNNGNHVEMGDYKSKSAWRDELQSMGFQSTPFVVSKQFSPEPYGLFRPYFDAFKLISVNQNVMESYITKTYPNELLNINPTLTADLEGPCMTNKNVPNIIPPKVPAFYRYGLNPYCIAPILETSLQNGWFMYSQPDNTSLGLVISIISTSEDKAMTTHLFDIAFGYTTEHVDLETRMRIADALGTACNAYRILETKTELYYLKETILGMLVCGYTPAQICENVASL